MLYATNKIYAANTRQGVSLGWIFSRLSILMLLVYSFFISMTEKFISSGASKMIWFILAGMMLLFQFIYYQRGRFLYFNWMQIGWLLIFAYAVARNVEMQHHNYTPIAYLAALTLIILFLPNNDQWFSAAIRIMQVFVYIHAVATIILFLFPNLYQYVVPYLNDHTYLNGYKSGITVHYSTNGIYLGIGCVVCWCKFFYSSKKTLIKAILAVLVTIALLLTTKRAHLLFAILAILFVYICGTKRGFSRWMKLLVIILIGVVAFLLLAQAIPEISDVIDRFLNPERGDITNGRMPMFTLAWNMFLDKPLLGWGWSSYRYQYLLFFRRTTPPFMQDAHNVYLQTLAEGGIVLFILFMLVVAFTLVRTWKQFKSSREINAENNNLSVYLAISLGIQIFFLLYCITGNPLYDLQCQIPYALACAISYAVMYKEHQKLKTQKEKEIHERKVQGAYAASYVSSGR